MNITTHLSYCVSVSLPVVWGLAARLLCWPLLPEPLQELLLSQVGIHLECKSLLRLLVLCFFWRKKRICFLILTQPNRSGGIPVRRRGAERRHHLFSAVDVCLALDLHDGINAQARLAPLICSGSLHVYVYMCVCVQNVFLSVFNLYMSLFANKFSICQALVCLPQYFSFLRATKCMCVGVCACLCLPS